MVASSMRPRHHKLTRAFFVSLYRSLGFSLEPGGRNEFDAYLAVLAQLTHVETARLEQRRQMQLEEWTRRRTGKETTTTTPPPPITMTIVTTTPEGENGPPPPPSSSSATSTPNSDAGFTPLPPLPPPPPPPLPTATAPSATPTTDAVDVAFVWRRFEKDLAKQVARRHHLKQPWFLRLSDPELTPDAICRVSHLTECGEAARPLPYSVVACQRAENSLCLLSAVFSFSPRACCRRALR